MPQVFSLIIRFQSSIHAKSKEYQIHESSITKELVYRINRNYRNEIIIPNMVIGTVIRNLL